MVSYKKNYCIIMNHDFTGHGVHNINTIIYNIVSDYFKFLICFLYITYRVVIYEYIS